ncbi:hypothetical protein [Deinococcus wulumuqiensis]|uniref:Uncharacterized protein n=1 Tax=Deinococcus wulumuqiensis TaxID=980427 RepID=A0AAV4KAH7_9DEIO|nr:hypothetical protein [Deinococcus wulumuqiensis]GGI84436.1 hypothetical protein GCM10010914_18500 [Deinococcus wulumuqiensis]GGP29787.1 hypothetical protein GCM10008021_14380 [Deinococcus wulumuqiensis]
MTPSPLNPPPATLSLLRELHGALRPAWAALPGQTSAGPVPEYRAAPVPENLRGDADAVVIDFDDTFAPTHRNLQAAYDALTEIRAFDKKTQRLFGERSECKTRSRAENGVMRGAVPRIT